MLSSPTVSVAFLCSLILGLVGCSPSHSVVGAVCEEGRIETEAGCVCPTDMISTEAGACLCPDEQMTWEQDRCVCPSDRTRCGNTCVNLAENAQHCGVCGQVCKTVLLTCKQDETCVTEEGPGECRAGQCAEQMPGIKQDLFQKSFWSVLTQKSPLQVWGYEAYANPRVTGSLRKQLGAAYTSVQENDVANRLITSGAQFLFLPAQATSPATLSALAAQWKAPLKQFMAGGGTLLIVMHTSDSVMETFLKELGLRVP